MDDLQRLLWWLVQGSAGAQTRVRVLRAIRSQPRNAQQLTDELGLDYSTVRHHLKVLSDNRLLQVAGDRYGQVYFLATSLETRWADFETIANRHSGSKGASKS